MHVCNICHLLELILILADRKLLRHAISAKVVLYFISFVLQALATDMHVCNICHLLELILILADRKLLRHAISAKGV